MKSLYFGHFIRKALYIMACYGTSISTWIIAN